MSKQLVKSTAIVSSMTMVSRLMGFVRDMLIARVFGVDPGTDAFFVAFKIPNFLRRLFAEGAFAHAFVPILIDYKQQARPEALKTFIERAAGWLALVLTAISLLGMLAAPLVIALFAPGFLWEPQQYELSVQMLRITMPYLLLIGLVAFAGGILNAHGKFAVPALTPIFLNITMIIAAIWFSPTMEEPVVALAWGVFAAGVVQLMFQIPALLGLGLLPRFRLALGDAGVKRVIALMLPAIFGVSVTQINLLVDTLMASFLTSGSVSWLYYSDRLVEFPLGVFGVAIATAILPSLSANHAADDPVAFSKSLDWGLRWVLLIGVPATLGLYLLAEPILSTLFQYDEFDVSDVLLSGQSLKGYALGLFAFILVKVLVAGFTSRQDTRTPVRFGMYSVVANIVLNGLLIMPLAHGGLALATSLAAYFNALLLLVRLLKNQIYETQAKWSVFFIRIILANTIMAVFLIYAVDVEAWFEWNARQRGVQLLADISLAALIYAVVLWLLGLRPRHLAG